MPASRRNRNPSSNLRHSYPEGGCSFGSRSLAGPIAGSSSHKGRSRRFGGSARALVSYAENYWQPYDCPGAGSCTTCLDERVTFISHDWPDPQVTDTVWFPEGTSGYTHIFERGPIETFPLPTPSIATHADVPAP